MFGGGEYKTLIEILEEHEPDLQMLGGYKFIKPGLLNLIKKEKAYIKTQINEFGKSPKELLYLLMRVSIRSQLFSGKFVTPEQELTPTGHSIILVYFLVTNFMTHAHMDAGDIPSKKSVETKYENQKLLLLEMQDRGIKNLPEDKQQI